MIAMIFAAGLGTRLKPFTDKHPKALATVNGKSLLQRNVEYLLHQNITEIVLNVHHFPEQIIDAITKNKGWGANIHISDESNEVLETGGGLKKAAKTLLSHNSDIVLLNVDILTDISLQKMHEQHIRSHSLATLAVSDRPTSRYLLFNSDMQLCGWENTLTGEKKTMRNESGLVRKAFSGLQIIGPTFLNLIHKEGKFSIIEIYLELCKTQIIQAYTEENTRFIDVGKPESILLAEKMFAEN